MQHRLGPHQPTNEPGIQPPDKTTNQPGSQSRRCAATPCHLEAAIDAAITRWMGWKIDRNTAREHGIPKGLPYLTGFVGLYEIMAEAE